MPSNASTPPASPEAFDVLIIGGGPIGLACAIEAKKRGLSHVVIEKGCVCNSIYHYPTFMRFFSTPELLEIGGVPFITQGEKPSRQEALEYYRRVAEGLDLNVRLYETVESVEGAEGDFQVRTSRGCCRARKIVGAIGFFDRPRMMGIPGEELPKVSHYYKEPHPYAGQELLIVGSGNSAVEAALECFRHGARVTMAVRGPAFHQGIKYWIKPDIENRIHSGEIRGLFNTRLCEVRADSAVLENGSGRSGIANDFVLALTGYEPDFRFLRRLGVEIQNDEHSAPALDPGTWETNRKGVYLAGVVVGGMCTNRWFIENSRAHALAIFDDIEKG